MPSNNSDHDGGASPSPPKPNQKFLSVILKFIIMTSITTFFFLFVGVAAILLFPMAVLHRRQSRQNQQRIESTNSSNGLSSKDLKKLPQFRYSRKSMVENDNDCAVYLDGFRQGQWCLKLSSCGHIYHPKCIDSWLVKVSACPICRCKIRFNDGCLLEDERPLWGFRHFVS